MNKENKQLLNLSQTIYELGSRRKKVKAEEKLAGDHPLTGTDVGRCSRRGGWLADVQLRSKVSLTYEIF